MPVLPANFGLQGFAFPTGGGAACDYPTEANVRYGVGYGSGLYTGTYGPPPTPAQDEYSPADVLAHLLTLLGQTTAPGLSQAWPVYVSSEPGFPDDAVTTYDTTPILDGRNQGSGETVEHYGVQVRLRSTVHTAGWVKSRAIKQALDGVYYATVAIGSQTYVVYGVNTLGIMALGKDSPTSKRNLFTINCTVALRKV
jgi:hypothetical protein